MFDQMKTEAVILQKGVLKNFVDFTWKHLCWSIFFDKVPTQLFSSEICEIFKNTYFYRTPPVATHMENGKSVTS